MSERAKEAKGWFCTYPKCTLTKEELLSGLQLKEKIVEYVIALEQHADGTPHLHAFIKLEKKRQFKADRFDVGEWHGNYQIAKSWHAVEQYVKKGGDYISNMDLMSALDKKGKWNKELANMHPVDAVDNGHIRLLDLPKLVQAQNLYKMLQQKRNREEIPILEKKRHVWNYGPSNTGKTTRLKEFMNEMGLENCFTIPYNNDWIGYNNEKYLIADEFKGQLTIQDLNRICDGGAKMNTKGGTVQLRWDVEVIICSNMEPDAVYCNCKEEMIKTVLNRFNINLYS